VVLAVSRHALLWIPLLALALAEPAAASVRGAILHEPIPPDPREDLAMHVALDGDLPAAIQTPGGVIGAPDPRAPTSATDSTYGTQSERSSFTPDRDTKRPEITTYDEPFTPSTAPFKRLEGYDAVRENYELYVRDPRLVALTTGAPPGVDDEAFYGDLVVELGPDRHPRIPSVGSAARIVRARLGVGSDDIAFHVVRDGADNWYLQAPGAHAGVRARFVMELAIPRSAFGGQMANPSWSDLIIVPPLPDNVARDAAQVRAAIGVSRSMRPRDAVARLVQYFRGFADSDEPPPSRGSVYLDLALSKKGVCRHRAFAFLVTALSLGIPTRMILNEAHAWVEIHDGTLWKRIDLGGAGHMTNPASDSLPERAVYAPPPDAFAWPQESERGDDMVADARARAAALAGGPASSASPAGSSASSSPSASPSVPVPSQEPGGPPEEHDDRPAASLSVATSPDAHRGQPLALRGVVQADGEPCAHVAVELWLRDAKTHREVLLGALATGEDGTFTGSIVVPGSTPLGDYDVVARTPGDARCGNGSSN
jgi:transglutaminase-like putative cysteine protease